MNAIDIGWVAGIIDGEGTICFRPSSKGSCYTEVSMTTPESIFKLKNVTGLGNTRGPYYREGKKPFWVWHVGDSRELARLYLAIYPFLSIEKKRQLILSSCEDIMKRIEGRFDKSCSFCGRNFSPTSSYNIYCSKNCSNKFHKIKQQPTAAKRQREYRARKKAVTNG